MPQEEPQNLIWIDCEFSSLDFSSNKIVEIAAVVTDSNLKVLGTPVHTVIHYSQEELDEILGEWTRKHFAESGLDTEIVASTTTLAQAERMVLDYISQYCEEGKSPLCGNSVSQDRRVLYTNMPMLEQFMHYRTIDVSTLKELARRWKPSAVAQVDKVQAHRALDDIYESIEELQIYRDNFLQHETNS